MIISEFNENYKKEDIESIIENLKTTKKPIEESIKYIKFYGKPYMMSVLKYSLNTGNSIVANHIYKSMFLTNLYKINVFIGKVEDGTYIEYLEGMTSKDKWELLNILATKLALGEIDKKYYSIIDEMNDMFLMENTKTLEK